jgi:lysophospholipase L1-like esterase
MLGDSLTEGGEWAELLGDARVKNRGISGDTSADVLHRLGGVLLGCPTQVFVMAGVNDLLHGVSVDVVADNHQRMLEALSATCPETRVVVQSCLPLDPYLLGTGDNGAIRLLNERLRGLAARYGATYVDLYSEFEANGRLKPGLSEDGLHLHGAGYLLWSEMIAPLLP